MRNKRILSFLVALVSLLTLLPAASAANDVYVGQTFYFGNYEQDGNLRNGDEPILWRVYSVDYGSRTVRAVSEYGLDSMVYNRSTSTTSWHNSTIRSWLNSTFLSSAFTSAEQGQLNSVYVSNSSDYVYILSQWEIQQYLDTELLYATEYARQCGAYTASDTGTSSYWARVDSTSTFGVFVGAHGSFYDHGNKVTEFDNAVRPAICVSFDVALGRWTPSSSDSSSGLLAMSNRPISTRSGPSTKYDELGTYWNDGGHTVTVLSRASGNDIWWLEVEFEYNGRKFFVNRNDGKFYDDYQLEDIENWCTEWLQKNIDENIVGIELIIDNYFNYIANCDKSNNYVLTKSDTKEFLDNYSYGKYNYYQTIFYYNNYDHSNELEYTKQLKAKIKDKIKISDYIHISNSPYPKLFKNTNKAIEGWGTHYYSIKNYN